ncbi:MULTISPECIES: aminotransferase class I/II-fold pyridoxal phosphate-dependent enzyme [unclassified Mucilaginibacter]|uniref:pyridoxal phosphate-dependent aminotransferase n=2 Tax=Mucilaginibacter TaxID=423349 RepID=UPI002AC8C474|nr:MULTISPECIES: aminotransferase class I/II-fold pyridoxal phosphate-dependent enzyme [unclassified Mucilaginibacter]MEB0248954.1 aminotransferase class I/II-fold pyridoxal phosphate-dependent enzyme [Mucilaginibacter sp. 5B2]MEB0278551.1 aminotransferase class I/II-fold pyridoxal phosphate-dependent enzyme [Mucilaginibacter sp. 10B2]MEB0299262.1 aminotransferase class I/II-fold pyridoxal phosphate-dependent enzyme [Mucilaginibacter sp. 5C4]WPX23492.1 aminotransferase class I/II-fold pyridoxal
MKVSVLAQNLSGSEIIKIAGEINELKKQGQNIANLTIGDFDSNIYPIPTELKDGIIDAYNHNQTNYPPADGMLSLRESVSAFLKNRMGLEYAANQILISGGSRPLIYSAYLALVDPGDKVVFPTPSWNNNHYCDLTCAEAILVETRPENNFMPTADEIAPHLKGATMLALCSPLNPTGTMFGKKDLEQICDLVIAENKSRSADEKPLYLLYDQIYSQLTFGEYKHYDPVTLRPELKDYTVFIDGGSKCFAATGVRVGWGFGPTEIISNMKAIVGHMGAWSPKAEQVAMAEYLENETYVDTYLDKLKSGIQASLTTLHEGFQALKADGFSVDSIEPMGAIYLTIKVDYTGKTTPEGQVLNNSTDVNFYLIKEAKVAFVPFSAFGTGDDVTWFRASVGASTLEDIQQMIPRIREALAKLK